MTVHCVFCDGTGVHECPGGELTSEYFKKLDCDQDTGWFLRATSSMLAPGLVDADCYPAIDGYKPLPAHPAMLEHRRKELAQ